LARTPWPGRPEGSSGVKARRGSGKDRRVRRRQQGGVESTVATALSSAGVQLTIFCATLVSEQPLTKGKGKQQGDQRPCAQPGGGVNELALEAGLAGSRASSPRRAVPGRSHSATTVPLPALPSVMPCCESTLPMVTTAISSPRPSFGVVQIFEMGFMRKAPRKEKGGHSRPGLYGICRRGIGLICFRA